jgi:hypothetical protein
MGWLIALGVLIFLACLPLGGSGAYGEAGAQLQLILGPVRLQLYPGKGKKEKKEKTPKEQQKKSAGGAKKQPQKGGSLSDFFPLVYRVLDFLEELRRKLRVNLLRIHVVMAAGDPCDLAVNYGKTMSALAALDPQLERFLTIQKKDVWVGVDFEKDKTLVVARMDLTITLGRILSLGVRHGFRILREYMNIMKLRKGGTVK